jgi:hypothetical protein
MKLPSATPEEAAVKQTVQVEVKTLADQYNALLDQYNDYKTLLDAIQYAEDAEARDLVGCLSAASEQKGAEREFNSHYRFAIDSSNYLPPSSVASMAPDPNTAAAIVSDNKVTDSDPPHPEDAPPTPPPLHPISANPTTRSSPSPTSDDPTPFSASAEKWLDSRFEKMKRDVVDGVVEGNSKLITEILSTKLGNQDDKPILDELRSLRTDLSTATTEVSRLVASVAEVKSESAAVADLKSTVQALMKSLTDLESFTKNAINSQTALAGLRSDVTAVVEDVGTIKGSLEDCKSIPTKLEDVTTAMNELKVSQSKENVQKAFNLATPVFVNKCVDSLCSAFSTVLATPPKEPSSPSETEAQVRQRYLTYDLSTVWRRVHVVTATQMTASAQGNPKPEPSFTDLRSFKAPGINSPDPQVRPPPAGVEQATERPPKENQLEDGKVDEAQGSGVRSSADQERQPREDQPREDQPREDQPREDQPRKDQPRKDRPRKDQPRKDQPRKDGSDKKQENQDQSGAAEGVKFQDKTEEAKPKALQSIVPPSRVTRQTLKRSGVEPPEPSVHAAKARRLSDSKGSSNPKSKS